MQHSGTRMQNHQYFFISINNKQSLKGVIQDAEYEIDVFQNFLHCNIAALHHCSKS